MFSNKATKIDENFTVNLTLCNKCQIDGEDFGNICCLLRKHELCQKIKSEYLGCITLTEPQNYNQDLII